MNAAPRPSTAAPILAVLAIVMPFVLYVGGYFWLGQESRYFTGAGTHKLTRIYRYTWESTIFKPAARLESWLRGIETRATHDGEFNSLSL